MKREKACHLQHVLHLLCHSYQLAEIKTSLFTIFADRIVKIIAATAILYNQVINFQVTETLFDSVIHLRIIPFQSRHFLPLVRYAYSRAEKHTTAYVKYIHIFLAILSGTKCEYMF